MSRDDDSFLTRWSRRKRTPDAAPDAGVDETERRRAAPESLAEETKAPLGDSEILETLGLKDPDALGPGDDFRGFMQKAVPEHLRRRALRRLWVSNPVLANLDGLNDYDGDFTGGTVAPGMLKTVYQVGLGAVRDVAAGSEPSMSVGASTPALKEGEDPQTQVRAETYEAETQAGEVVADAGPTPADVRRRMRFRFGDDEE